MPALTHLARHDREESASVSGVAKTGRTHLMDAMPITLARKWAAGPRRSGNGIERIDRYCRGCMRCRRVARPSVQASMRIRSSPRASRGNCRRKPGWHSRPSENFFESLSSQDTAVELSGQLKAIAVSIMKIANDLRWMNSGPLAGLGEIALPALQPGSSIMPGKVNPVIPEAATMVAAQVIGNDATITIGGQSGNFQLNVMLPVIAYNLLQSIELLANVSRLLGRQSDRGLHVDRTTSTWRSRAIRSW